MSVEGTNYSEVIANLIATVVAIPDTIAVPDLGGRDTGSPTKTVCRLDDLGAKHLQTEHPQTSSNPILRSIHQPLLRLRQWGYWPFLSSSGV